MARRRALHLVLDAIAASRWVDALVLRGGVLMSVWLGDAAREPGDLDFVVVPPTWRIDDGRTDGMLRGIATAAQAPADARGGEIGISARGAVVEDIWTYDRVPGRRMLRAAARGVPAVGRVAVPPPRENPARRRGAGGRVWGGWDHFVTEYPRFADAEREYAERLVRAVTPTFDGVAG
ncbi:nucleotidyl transferase AbiEii/AbiGii toxin family protein [Streptomyces echinatus]|uniref:Nucleotidyl transferase AbiEii/AbiGii toxin family protein n=1 Tax=Streptomyces echinatus TaxID=67293 RepID=A0A7W9UVA2_9ACTN|nr:nucleotidyl transferase AbiEii/AbiGii toxin family protein [Streptomyces echinatus]MBB5931484.1 hypothetical protein [Streptomyces echinatus]